MKGIELQGQMWAGLQMCLTTCAGGESLGSGISELEVQDKLTSRVLNRWSEFPTLRRFTGQPGEILARSGRSEISSHDAAGRINLDSHADLQGALNRVAGFLRHVGQNLLNDAYSAGIRTA